MPTKTLAELAAVCGAVLDGDPDLVIEGPSTLQEAGPREITFLANPRYAPQIESTRAGAVLVAKDQPRPREGLALLRCDDPNRAFTQVVLAFAPPSESQPPGVHPSAVVDPLAEIGPGAAVGPGCTVAAHARIGARAVLVAGVHVGAHARVGEGTVLHPGVVLYPRVSIGARGLVHAGVVIGSDGFGFEPTRTGWNKIPQVGTVEIGDDVEIGANCAIDRGRFGPTKLGNGVKLDNLVHVAHNVVVEDGALLIAQVGVAGSTRIGQRAILAGQVGVAGHATIGAGARIGAQSGVAGEVPAGADYFGSPARPRNEALRSAMIVTRLPEMQKLMRDLQKRIMALEAAVGRGLDGDVSS